MCFIAVAKVVTNVCTNSFATGVTNVLRKAPTQSAGAAFPQARATKYRRGTQSKYKRLRKYPYIDIDNKVYIYIFT